MEKRYVNELLESQLPLPCHNLYVESDVEREEALWVPPENEPEFITEYCSVAKRHQNLELDEALHHLFLHNYNVESALQNLEERQSSTVVWNSCEINIFKKNLDATLDDGSTRFQAIAKRLPTKSMAQIVEYFYRIKYTRCPTLPNQLFCRSRMKIFDEKTSIKRREQCDNCVKNLWTLGFARRHNSLCLPCALYFRMQKKHRPFSIKLKLQQVLNVETELLDNQRINSEEMSNSDVCSNEFLKSTASASHFCYFEPLITKNTTDPNNWSYGEIKTCINGFQQFGLNFVRVASLLTWKNEYDVALFYAENELKFNLNIFIEKHRQILQVNAAAEEKKLSSENGNSGRKTKRLKNTCTQANNWQTIGIHRVPLKDSDHHYNSGIQRPKSPSKKFRHSGISPLAIIRHPLSDSGVDSNVRIQTRNQRRLAFTSLVDEAT